jgi:uncharacterized protein (DUF4415 family)
MTIRAITVAVAQIAANGDTMKYQTSDGRGPTPTQIARLDEIEARDSESIDFPPAPEANRATAVRGKHGNMTGGTVSICLDPDIQAWLRAKGSGYQAEVNRVLRQHMLAEGQSVPDDLLLSPTLSDSDAQTLARSGALRFASAIDSADLQGIENA